MLVANPRLVTWGWVRGVGWANSSKRRTAAEEKQSRAEENMRALKADVDVLHLFRMSMVATTRGIIVKETYIKSLQNTRYIKVL